ncbi:MAG: hypothetical protein ACTS6J_05905 [Burkholderiales bacterium]
MGLESKVMGNTSITLGQWQSHAFKAQPVRFVAPYPPGSVTDLLARIIAPTSGIFDPAAGPEKPQLKALAIHLSDSGARFFGTYWCPTCREQKALFEASADRLPYVECTPGGRNGPVSVACVTNDIKRYPTWIIGGVHHTGIVSASELARLSGFEWSADAARKK